MNIFVKLKRAAELHMKKRADNNEGEKERSQVLTYTHKENISAND
jgi:hypothetical protein